ncbi:MAG TPA: hypothetical protein VFX13_01980 [Gaiellales bacterium]|nr:hypothetical protein [Gaiellales bacterium]
MPQSLIGKLDQSVDRRLASLLTTRGMIERLSEEELWRQRGGEMSDPPVSQANRLDGGEVAIIRRMGRAEARIKLRRRVFVGRHGPRLAALARRGRMA